MDRNKEIQNQGGGYRRSMNVKGSNSEKKSMETSSRLNALFGLEDEEEEGRMGHEEKSRDIEAVNKNEKAHYKEKAWKAKERKA